MRHSIRRSALLLFIPFAICAAAQNPTNEIASETFARLVTLPASAQGSLVMAPCAGCPLKSFRATNTTVYFINERQVTLAELKAVTTAQPEIILTVSYSAKDAELIRVSAAVAELPKTNKR